jgi:hypothetical protein
VTRVRQVECRRCDFPISVSIGACMETCSRNNIKSECCSNRYDRSGRDNSTCSHQADQGLLDFWYAVSFRCAILLQFYMHLSTGQTYLAVAAWANSNGYSYILRWRDETPSREMTLVDSWHGLDVFQIIPTASVDVSYIGWPASQEEKVDSLDGMMHILALVDPGVLNGAPGSLSIYKFSFRAQNSISGMIEMCGRINL